MGGSKGTLWSYFDSKEKLFEAVIEGISLDFRADLLATLETVDAPAGVLNRFVEKFLQKISSPKSIALQRMIISERGRFPVIG